VLFIATGCIVYLALFVSKLIGKNFLDETKPKNEFDSLFLSTMMQAVLIYSIAIPFFMIDRNTLPLTLGILTGTMWMSFSWVIKHWVGVFHAILRTILLVSLWYIFPDDRFVLIPFAIALVYIVTIIMLKNRKGLLAT
jgi:ethanolamine transporter EutH